MSTKWIIGVVRIMFYRSDSLEYRTSNFEVRCSMYELYRFMTFAIAALEELTICSGKFTKILWQRDGKSHDRDKGI